MWHRVSWVVLSLCLLGIQPTAVAEPLDLSTLLPPDDKSTEPAAENPDGSSPATPQTEANTPAPTDVETAVPPPPAQTIPAETPTTAEQPGVLQLPRAPKTSTINMPGRGMKKPDVEARFGAPREKTEAVGKPPISSWVYPDFTVYFEHDTVLHAATHDP